MAKHKYRDKKAKAIVPDTIELPVESETVSPEVESAPMTKRARRRAKEAEALGVSSQSSSSVPEKERVITSDKYKSMTATRSRPTKTKRANQRKGIEAQQTFWKRLALWFRAMKAELKAVSWPSFKSSAKVTGVWANIGTVFLVVLFFLVVITAFDSGLTSLFKLLVGIGVN